MVLCDASTHNPQKFTSILAKNHDFEHNIKLRLIYGTNVGKKRKNKKNVVCFFFFSPREKKTEKCASGEVGRSSYVSAEKKKKLYPFDLA